MRLKRVEPSSVTYGLGMDVGYFVVRSDAVKLMVFDEGSREEIEFDISPDLGPMFRSIAYRLDQIDKQRLEP